MLISLITTILTIVLIAFGAYTAMTPKRVVRPFFTYSQAEKLTILVGGPLVGTIATSLGILGGFAFKLLTINTIPFPGGSTPVVLGDIWFAFPLLIDASYDAVFGPTGGVAAPVFGIQFMLTLAIVGLLSVVTALSVFRRLENRLKLPWIAIVALVAVGVVSFVYHITPMGMVPRF